MMEADEMELRGEDALILLAGLFGSVVVGLLMHYFVKQKVQSVATA
jgi:hypothetical protein